MSLSDQRPEMWPSTGQKVAGWILRLFGLVLFMIAGANFAMVGALFLSEPETFSPGAWLRPVLILIGSGLGMLVGSAMRALAKIILGEVRIVDQGVLMRWCLGATFRDGLFLTGAFYLLVGLSVVIYGKWVEAMVAAGIGGLGLWFGVMVNGAMRRLGRNFEPEKRA